MQVNQTKHDDLNLTVSIQLEKADYADAQKKRLNDFRRKADLKGFRKGMAPMSLIEKMYGGQALGETINNIVSSQLNKYIEDNKLDVLGEPLPSEKEDKNDWENGESFTFDFDLGLAPDLSVDVTAEDIITYYDITVNAKALADYKDSMLRQYGSMESGEAVGEDDFMVADFAQGETTVKDAYVSLRSMDEAAKSMFIGLKKDDTLDVNINEVFVNETDRAAMLHSSKEELAAMEPVWKMTIKEVKTFVAAQPTVETFDKMFGEGQVKDDKEFDARVKELLKKEYVTESDYRFSVDAREYLINKANISLPEAFLKRWLLAANEGKFTAEDIEKEFEGFAKDFCWQMICSHLLKTHDLQVTKEDIERDAKEFAAYQFAMYGMNNVPDEQLTSFAKRILEDKEQVRRIYEKAENNLVVNYIKGIVSFDKKKTTIEKIRQMNQQK